MAGMALRKEAVWEATNYRPHSGQQLLHQSHARNRLASCGRRFGKSRAGGMELVPVALATHTQLRMLEEEGLQRYYWIVGPNYDDAEREWRVFYDAMRKLKVPMDRPGTYNDTVGGNMRMSLWGGRFIAECKSAAHPESLDGEGLDGVLMVEAAKIKYVIWNKFIRPALADKRGWSWLTSTPEGRNWFYELYLRGQDPNEAAWESWRMPSWRNNIVFPLGKDDPEIAELRADMSEEKFDQEIAASFTDFVGRVFKTFEREYHVRHLPYNPAWPLYLAIDYGWTNPFVVLFVQVDVFDNVYVIAEYRQTQMDTAEIAKELRSWMGGLAMRAVKMYPDPAEPDRTHQMSKILGVPAAPHTGGLLATRLELIRNHLKLVPEHVPIEQRSPKLFIDKSCTGLIFEMEEYRYPEQKNDSLGAPEMPMQKDDHGPEALGRFFKGYYQAPAEVTGRARVSRANLSGNVAGRIFKRRSVA